MVIKLLTIYNCLDYETELGNKPDMPLTMLILEIFCRFISFALTYIYMKMSHHYLGGKKKTDKMTVAWGYIQPCLLVTQRYLLLQYI